MPVRFRCVGCGHFRSDPSYLSELHGDLDMLLRNRERVCAAVELEAWARAEAMPSDQEIGRVRALIRRVELELEQLSEEERGQIDEACRGSHRGAGHGPPPDSICRRQRVDRIGFTLTVDGHPIDPATGRGATRPTPC